MEFETAIRKNLQIVVVISNDLGWGMIRHSQELSFGQAIEDGTFIGSVPYHKLVEDLGGKGFFVENPEDIAPTLEKAFAPLSAVEESALALCSALEDSALAPLSPV